MSKQANLFLVVNLGCEMLYVVDQRLKAQKVTSDKAIRVLTEITGILFNDHLINELSESHEIRSYEYIRTLLEDIVSVSIMRLDPFSMNKLWELMTMVFKWQITLIEPQELIPLTKRHLEGIKKLKPGIDAISKVERTSDRFDKICRESTLESLTLARNALLFWLNDFRTKVSLLLRLGLQRNDGSFILIKNPSDSNWSYVHNIGENIYSYQDDNDVTPKENVTKSCNVETSEISFIENLLGEKEMGNKETFKLDIFPKSVNETVCETDNKIQMLNTNCEFETQSEFNKSSKSGKNIILDDKNHTSTSTLHEDLLVLLDKEFEN